MSLETVPKELRRLRACLLCSLVKVSSCFGFIYCRLNNSAISSVAVCIIITVYLPQFFTSVEVELPQQLKSIGKPLVLAIFGSELAILTAFCCFFIVT